MNRFYKNIILVLAYMVLSSSPGNAAVPDGFAGVPWGATTMQIQQSMAERGWRSRPSSSPNTMGFEGSFAESNCIIWFTLEGNSLVRGSASFCALFPNLKTTALFYDKAVSQLTEKYGQPNEKQDVLPAGGAYVRWNFNDGATSDEYTITARLDSDGVWTTNRPGKSMYFDVYYEAVSLSKRLKKSQI